MNDPYLYEGTSVLRNLLNIYDEKELDVAEAEISSANMMLLYDKGFSDFTTEGIKEIHKTLFGELYDWAGKFRTINVQKREKLLAGKSVWYANSEDIERDLDRGWAKINEVSWITLSREQFVKNLSRTFPSLWQTHPFREGNTRTIVMLMTFFVEHYGFYFDQELLAVSAGYVRDAFVLASFGEYSEYEHMERILNDTVSDEQIDQIDDLDDSFTSDMDERYEKYRTENYRPTAHEYRADDAKPEDIADI
jgi:cell filamentation protein